MSRLGEQHQRAKLSNAQVRDIRDMGRRGLSHRFIAAAIGISRAHVGRILRFEMRNDINGVSVRALTRLMIG